jgi:hypothetical protein
MLMSCVSAGATLKFLIHSVVDQWQPFSQHGLCCPIILPSNTRSGLDALIEYLVEFDVQHAIIKFARVEKALEVLTPMPPAACAAPATLSGPLAPGIYSITAQLDTEAASISG